MEEEAVVDTKARPMVEVVEAMVPVEEVAADSALLRSIELQADIDEKQYATSCSPLSCRALVAKIESLEAAKKKAAAVLHIKRALEDDDCEDDDEDIDLNWRAKRHKATTVKVPLSLLFLHQTDLQGEESPLA